MGDERIFKTDKRIRLGIWGLGRGGRLADSARLLNIDIVAGCDIHPYMRETFRQAFPEAFVSADEDTFLAQDFDAVLIATYLPDHAKHILKALAAGKHILCEVTPFRTPADGVRVVEAVEKSGKIFNLLENYPFTRENTYVRKLWREGFFGDFMYGEGCYVHECRVLQYAYNVSTGLPIEPGYHLHNWRSTLNIHHYCTHSLGPVMCITGLRPVEVSAFPCDVHLPGHMSGGTACPSMIRMSNGGLFRNFMGATTNDRHFELRLWGTNASMENIHELKIRVGACGGGPLLNVKADWSELADVAGKTEHNGGDFWELYYFAREFLTGEPAPWDIYSAADATLAGLMAARSEENGGKPLPIPDFRNPAERDAYRNDQGFPRPPFDPEHIFPEGHDPKLTGHFNTVMAKFYPLYPLSGIPVYHMALDGMKIYDDIADEAGKMRVVENVGRLIHCLPELAENCLLAQKIADAYPDSRPGVMLRGVLADVDLDRVLNVEATRKALQEWLDSRYAEAK